MRRKQNPQNKSTNCKNVWEVHLPPEQVQEIRKCAQAYQKTMSWIVRFCIHKLCRKRILHLPSMQDMALQLRTEYKELKSKKQTLHRFQLCLYGEDEIILKTLANHMYLTVSMVIRIALRRYLSTISKRAIPEWRLFWFGIKLCKDIRTFVSWRYGLIEMDFRHRVRYSKDDFYGIPEGIYPSYLR